LRLVRPHSPEPLEFGRALGVLRTVAIELDLADEHPLVAALDPAANPWPTWSQQLDGAGKPQARRTPTATQEDLDVVRRARAIVDGATTLVVNNRGADDALVEHYQVALGLARLDWCDISQGPTVVENKCKRIRAGSYGLVLLHTGFGSHSVVGKIEQACRAAKVRYVRARKGRPVAVATAILEAFGAR
jgi:hypothetical protein